MHVLYIFTTNEKYCQLFSNIFLCIASENYYIFGKKLIFVRHDYLLFLIKVKWRCNEILSYHIRQR